MEQRWCYVSFAVICFMNGLVPVFTSTCCPDTWVAFQGSCYLFPSNKAVDFYEAQHFCEQHNADIVRAETSVENLFLKDYMRGILHVDRWLGLTDETIESVWKWYRSNAVTTYTDWYPGDPNNGGAGEDCVAYSSRYDFVWYDISCTNKFSPICEKKVTATEIVG